jgi:hypothetical protein
MKRGPLLPCYLMVAKNDRFTKTGSGQAPGKREGKRGDHSAGLTIVTSGAVMIGIGGLSQGYEMSNQVRF